MQSTGLSMEHEAARLLPDLLADLLDEDGVELGSEQSSNRGADVSFADSQGRRWLVEYKASSRPGIVADAARQLRSIVGTAGRGEGWITLLVVPHMSEAGARAAEAEGVNWLDLSGNASIRAENLHIWVQGRPKVHASRGRPSSPFARKSARVTRVLLLEPSRWWRQKDLVAATGLDDSTISRVVRRLADELLLERRGHELRPSDPGLLLDAWAGDYRFERHDVVAGHVSGEGITVARELANRLSGSRVHHAFTGLAAAWAIDHFARFRLTSVYVEGDPRAAVDALGVRHSPRGANVQLMSPDDAGVFVGEGLYDGLNCVSPAQIYLDLLNLPERADEAARHLRAGHLPSRGTT